MNKIYENEKERKRAEKRRYYLKYRSKVLATVKLWKANNPNKLKEQKRRYRQRRKEKEYLKLMGIPRKEYDSNQGRY